MSSSHKADPRLILTSRPSKNGLPSRMHEVGVPTDPAKGLAAQGFRNQAQYWACLKMYVERKRLEQV